MTVIYALMVLLIKMLVTTITILYDLITLRMCIVWFVIITSEKQFCVCVCVCVCVLQFSAHEDLHVVVNVG